MRWLFLCITLLLVAAVQEGLVAPWRSTAESWPLLWSCGMAFLLSLRPREGLCTLVFAGMVAESHSVVTLFAIPWSLAIGLLALEGIRRALTHTSLYTALAITALSTLLWRWALWTGAWMAGAPFLPLQQGWVLLEDLLVSLALVTVLLSLFQRRASLSSYGSSFSRRAS